MTRGVHAVGAIGIALVCSAPASAQALAAPASPSLPPPATGTIIVQGDDAQGASPQGLPPRDPRAPATGTAHITGTITAADTGRPLRRATVRVMGAPVQGMRTAATDADGRYDISELPAGRYTVVAARTGYVQTNFGQKRPNTPGQPVVVQDGATTVRVDIALPLAGVLTGRVVDELGEPVSDVLVSAMRWQFMGGDRRLVPAGSMSPTNDIGEFRIHSITPGDYFVSAMPRQMGQSSDRAGYATTFYPSAPQLDTAQRVAVHAGETVSNMTIMLNPAHLNRVTGVVLGADGAPLRGGGVNATLRGGVMMSSAGGAIRADGTFEIGGLADGEYLLRALVGPLPMGGPGVAAGPPLSATAVVTLAGADVSNVVLRPAQAITLSGRVTGDPAALTAIRPGAMQILAARLGMNDATGPMPPPARLRDDFTFELSAYPGRIALRGAGLNGLLIESVRWNGTDVTRGFDLPEGVEASGFEVTLTDRTARLVATVTDAKREPSVGSDVLIFPTDETWWGPSMPGYTDQGRTDAEGRFQSLPLLPGSYFVVAVDGLETFRSSDPEFLASVHTRAQRITLAAGDTREVEIQVHEP
jgi:hypothetical protein